MELMAIRRGLMSQMAGNRYHASGVFTGDGTNSVSIQIPFKPDVLVIAAGLDYSTSGWAGVGDAIMCRRKVSVIVRHSNATATGPSANAYPIYDNDGEFGSRDKAQQYTFYGNYNNGVMTLTNIASVPGTAFINNQQYTWDAYVE